MIKKAYEEWVNNCDGALKDELISIKDDDKAIEDRFYKHLEFGTGGLRGRLGAGINRMNIYTVRRATKGLAEYTLAVGGSSIAIAYDSRNGSYEFAASAAAVLADNGIKAYIYSELMPTPMLSFAVRQLKCAGGIVITASHNPSVYNGYKVYGSDGCQITNEAAATIYECISKVTDLFSIEGMSFEEGLADGKIEYIDESVIKAYDDAVFACSTGESDEALKIVYTPLSGAGNKPVRRVLERAGFKSVSVVKEQENPNGDFPTCTYPNPEEKAALTLAIEQAEKEGAELVLATDPDSDRVGIAVAADNGFRLFNGNETGVLLLDYLLSSRKKNGTLPKAPEVVTTIVTTPMAFDVAAP